MTDGESKSTAGEFDYVIAGGGSAGCALAALSAKTRR